MSATSEPASQVLPEGTVPLSLNTRGVGAVTIVRCSGRIVAGETEILRKHVSELLRDRTEILLHLGEIVFIDSDEPLRTGQPFPYGGMLWLITKDDGPSAVEGYVVRFICEPATH